MTDRKKIIWLEDKPEDYGDIKARISRRFDVIECIDLDEFRVQVEGYRTAPNEIAGFIVDVMIKVDDLTQLGLPDVLTRKGTDTGVKVVAEYLRNFSQHDECKHISEPFAQTRILMLSSLVGLKAKYSHLIRQQNIEMITKYAPKYIQADWLKDLDSWLNF